MSIKMADSIRAMIAGLDAGQKQFLANHLWKHYRVCPQRIKDYVPEEEFRKEPDLSKGELVVVDGQLGVITAVDKADDLRPYRVHFGNDYEWYHAHEVQRFTPPE